MTKMLVGAAGRLSAFLACAAAFACAVQPAFADAIVAPNPAVTARPGAAAFNGKEWIDFRQNEQPVTAPLAIAVSQAAPRVRAMTKVCETGDSNKQFGKNSATGNLQNTNATSVNWLRWIERQRFYTDQSLNFAVASMKTDYWLSTEVPAAIAAKCDVVISNIGTNDIASGTPTVAQAITNYRAGALQLAAAGIALIAESVPPQTAWSTAVRNQAAAFNRQLFALAQDRTLNVRFVDLNPSVVDYSTGSALTNYLFDDGVHIAPLGGQAIAQAEAQVIDALVPPAAELLTLSNADQFDGALNPFGSFLINGLLSGTGGTLTNGGTGACSASNFCGRTASTATTLTAAFSAGTEAGNATIPTQIMTLGGTADTTGVGGLIELAATLPSSGVAAGDKVAGTCALNWTGAQNLKSIALHTIIADPTSGTQNAYDGQQFNPNGTTAKPMPGSSNGTYVFRTPAITLGAAPTSLRLRVEAFSLTSGSPVALVLAASRCDFRKVGQGPNPEN